METLSEAKSEIRLKFFDLLFGKTEGYLCIANKDQVGRFGEEYFLWPQQRVKAEEYILKVEPVRDVYYCVNLLTRTQRIKENCLPSTNLVWADLDDVSPDALTKIPPPIVVRSSLDKWQAIWRMSAPVPARQAEEYSKRVAYYYGADKSGWDLTQLLRVPFTLNFKYDPPEYIELDRALEITAKPLLFEALPAMADKPEVPLPTDLENLTLNEILMRFRPALNRTSFGDLFTQEPEKDWSGSLWKLIHICYRAGMNAEEVFTVVREAKCNKYARDNRPIEHLWKEVIKAGEPYDYETPTELISMPVLVDAPHSTTFIDEYRTWAEEATDAVPDFHDLCIFVALSAIISSSVKLETSAGHIVPNLWGLLVGESTLTRKTTAMRLITDFLIGMDREIIAVTDGSSEGLLNAIAARPNRASVYLKDEVSSLFDGMSKKDYMAGMQETLTALYDSPPMYVKRLSKQTVIIEHPAFIFLGGGVPDRIHESTNESFVLSGFLPRFLVAYQEEADMNRYKPLGPPTQSGLALRPAIFQKLADLHEIYATDVVTKVGGEKVEMPARYRARLTDEAWKLYGEYEVTLLKAARQSLIKNLALPTLDRLSRSILKMAVVLGAVRQKPKNSVLTIEAEDIINAAWYGQRWGKNSIKLIVDAGKGSSEKTLEKFYSYIIENPGCSRTALLKRFKLDSKTTSTVLLLLEERMMIRSEKVSGTKGWRFWPI